MFKLDLNMSGILSAILMDKLGLAAEPAGQ